MQTNPPHAVGPIDKLEGPAIPLTDRESKDLDGMPLKARSEWLMARRNAGPLSIRDDQWRHLHDKTPEGRARWLLTNKPAVARRLLAGMMGELGEFRAVVDATRKAALG